MVTDAIHKIVRAKVPFGNAQGEVGIQHFRGIVKSGCWAGTVGALR
jgi:hypothetical protein